MKYIADSAEMAQIDKYTTDDIVKAFRQDLCYVTDMTLRCII